jgi:hypothetical protein
MPMIATVLSEIAIVVKPSRNRFPRPSLTAS